VNYTPLKKQSTSHQALAVTIFDVPFSIPFLDNQPPNGSRPAPHALCGVPAADFDSVSMNSTRRLNPPGGTRLAPETDETQSHEKSQFGGVNPAACPEPVEGSACTHCY
jgi:hypothetical protein